MAPCLMPWVSLRFHFLTSEACSASPNLKSHPCPLPPPCGIIFSVVLTTEVLQNLLRLVIVCLREDEGFVWLLTAVSPAAQPCHCGTSLCRCWGDTVRLTIQLGGGAEL